MTKFRRGDRLGDWELLKREGEGRNGEVWQVTRPQSEPGALKILHRLSPEGFERFKREIEIGSGEDAEELGLLPVWDAYVPALPLKPDDPPWFVMPLAAGLQKAVGNATFPERVEAVRQVATLLAVLLQRFGLNHRDIKPANLYWWRGRVAIGDLGLARRPEDPALSGDKAVGPIHHLPSEVVVGHGDVDWERVDVHCLANSLWQLIAGTPNPPRGHISADGEYSLVRYTDDEQARQLALLIDGATSESPKSRPTLAEFEAQLGDLLAARELRDAIRREDERIRRNSNRVLRWLVAHVRDNPVFDKLLWQIPDPAAPSGIDDLTDAEVGEAIEELANRYLISANRRPRMGGRTDWSGLYPTPHGITEVEDVEVILAQAAPILRHLLSPQQIVSFGSHSETIGFGDVSFRPSEAYFLFRLLRDLGYVSYENMAEHGEYYIDVKTSPTGRDWLVAHYG